MPQVNSSAVSSHDIADLVFVGLEVYFMRVFSFYLPARLISDLAISLFPAKESMGEVFAQQRQEKL